MTLVEVLVVVVILALLAGLAAPRVLQYVGRSQTQATELRLGELAAALELYRLDVGRYPSTAQGLRALLEEPADEPAWAGPYLGGRGVPRDALDRPFIYRSSEAGDTFVLRAADIPDDAGQQSGAGGSNGLR